MFAGALVAGILTTVLINVIHKRSRVKQDAAIGIAFSTLFAVGVILISLYADKVDLDQECVLYGEIAFVPLAPIVQIGGVTLGPEPVFRMGIVTLVTGLLIVLFYKELLVSSFDPGLAASLGISAGVMHYTLMSMLSVVVVSAFESVGAILVIAMLILPGATASLLSHRLPVVLALSVVHGALSSLLGIHLAVWLDCSMAAAMVVMGAALFTLVWIFSPRAGLLGRWLARRPVRQPMPSAEPTPAYGR
jgi:manganese/zinc/iron transport system permease protein